MASESSKNGSGGISFLATINNAKVNPFFIPANKLTYFFINWLGFLSTPYFQATKPWVWITKPCFVWAGVPGCPDVYNIRYRNLLSAMQ